MTATQERQTRPPRRQVLRVDAQDGPWTVSVAENPHHPSSYTLYVKTPTHNLTLSRTAREIVELDHKLHDAYPSVFRPALPIDSSVLPQPTKRKSVILNTLSRLASPASKSTGARNNAPRPATASTSSPIPSTLPTPVVSPKAEIADPFFDDLGEVAVGTSTSANPTITGLAAYLTTLSNDQVFRQARPWKRFVRVRTDDLESVRVERAIRRVRSDVAAHLSSPSTVNVTMHNTSVLDDTRRAGTERKSREETLNGNAPGLERRASRFREDIDGAETRQRDDISMHDTEPTPSLVSDGKSNTEDMAERTLTADGRQLNGDAASTASSAKSDVIEIEASDNGSIALPSDGVTVTDASVHPVAPSTPLPAAVEHPSRIPRSQSADPDKAARLSRVFTQSATSVGVSGTETPSASASATEDDSSVNTSLEHRERKKRSKSAARIKERVSRKVQVADFEMMRVLGKGCAGKVLLVRHKNSSDLYALKAITKRHVLAHQELQHTLTEQAVLRRMAAEGTDPFVVKLWWSFHDKENLFLVMDFHPGGDLATQLARWGRLGRDRARFYAAEIVEGVEGLHAAGVVYRDLKPENILIAADGHIVLTDFGLSKEFPKPGGQHVAPSTPPAAGSPYWMKDDKELAAQWPSRHVDTTSTFCGTAEYLAPEVIQGLPYSYEVDWWSFGTMLYEMLTGITPFWADNHSDMYVRVLQDELQFPDDRALDQDTKGLIRGLLQRNPALRISEPRIKRHPYFSMIDWAHVYYKRYIPPYIPPIDPSNASDTQNFDDTFLDMEPVINDENDMDTDQEREREQTDLEPTDGEDSVAAPSQSRSSSAHPPDNDLVDVFDGYSFKGRHSVIIDDEEEVSEEGDEDEEENLTGPSIPAELNGDSEAAAATVVLRRDEPIPEPKTPEARPTALPPSTPPAQRSPVSTRPELPPVDTSAKPASFTDATPRASEDAPGPVPSVPISPLKAVASAAAAASTGPDIHHKEPKKAPVSKPHGQRSSRQQRSRREKSGVPALDRDLSDANEEEDVRTERDDDDEWDFIEADGEERNGARGTSLFARGVVDRYRLAVFRKGSTPNRTTPSDAARLSAAATTNGSSSPSPTAKDRRGRTGALPFGRKTFLRAKSPPSTSTRSSRSAGKSFTTTSERSVSATVSTVSSPQSARTTLAQPSLRSKESAVSVGSPGSSSGASTNGEGRAASDPDIVETVRAPQAEEHDLKHKNKKLKRGAEKMLSLFALP
ncbi:kinase-like protein [Lactarius hatsudake]|nr:kinase-like protein [Lactarius hatsudake]